MPFHLFRRRHYLSLRRATYLLLRHYFHCASLLMPLPPYSLIITLFSSMPPFRRAMPRRHSHYAITFAPFHDADYIDIFADIFIYCRLRDDAATFSFDDYAIDYRH